MTYQQYQSFQGPTDPSLRHSLIEGYQPVSRIGEVVINAFVDAYEFAQLHDQVKGDEIIPGGAAAVTAAGGTVEVLPKPFGVRPSHGSYNQHTNR